jgi:trigger factor
VPLAWGFKSLLSQITYAKRNNVEMTKEVTRLEKSNVRLTLTIPKEETLSQYRDMVKDIGKDMQIPGFRKGKVPQDVLERKFGEALRDEALGKIISKAIGEVFDDETLPRDERPLPYSQPRMDEEPKLDFDQDLCFSIVYDVLPKVSVGQWKGLEIEAPHVEITDEDIARELEELRDRNAFVLDRDEGAQAQSGDVVTVSYCEIGEDGEETPNSRRDDFAFTLGSGNNIYQIDDDIVGMKKGETREFTNTYPDGDPAKELAGRTVKLRVTLDALKEKKLPDLDDDLAQDIDEKFSTLDDLKNSIRGRLEKIIETRLREIKTSRLLEKIMENTPVILPESMVMAELDGRLRNLARRFGSDTDRIMEMLAQADDGFDNIQEKWRPSAEKALHSRLIVETLMEEQKIEAGDEDVEKELERISGEAGLSVEEMRTSYEENNAMEYLKDDIRERKFFDWLFSENTIKAGSKTNYLDLMANNG